MQLPVSNLIFNRSSYIALGLLILAAALYWYARDLGDDEKPDRLVIPTLVGSGFHGVEYVTDGSLKHKLDAENVTYYEDQNRYDLTHAHLTHYDYGSSAEQSTAPADRKQPATAAGKAQPKMQPKIWFLDSEEATIYAGDVAYLRKNVHLYPSFPGSTVKQVATDRADYDMKSRLITSDDTVIIYGDRWINTGHDFIADIKTNQITYKGKPNVTYYPKEKHHAEPTANPAAAPAAELSSESPAAASAELPAEPSHEQIQTAQ